MGLRGEAALCFSLLVDKGSYPCGPSIWSEVAESAYWVVEVLLSAWHGLGRTLGALALLSFLSIVHT